MKYFFLISILGLFLMTAMFIVAEDKQIEEFDACDNARYFVHNYNSKFYNEGSVELYEEIKQKIVEDCG